MRLRYLAWANLRRHPGRAALNVIALAAAVSCFVLVLSLVLSLRSGVDEKLSQYGSSLLVTPNSPQLSLSYGGISLGSAGSGEVPMMDESALDKIRSVPSSTALTAVIPVLLQSVEIQGTRFLAVGTDVAESASMKPWWKVEGKLPENSNQVLLGLNVRNELRAEPGQTITVNGKPFEVAGVLWESGDDEDNLVVMDRGALADLTGQGTNINLVEVTAVSTSYIDGLAAEIEVALPAASVATVKKSIEFTNQANTALADLGVALTSLIVLISGLVVFITMLAAVKERRREIGVMRAAGYKHRHIRSVFLTETVLVSLIGAVIGGCVSLAAWLLGGRFAFGHDSGAQLNPLVVVLGIGLSFAIGALATLYPAWRAANLDPVEALKQV